VIGLEGCPFCKRIEAKEYDRRWGDAVTFEPLNPVTPGHRLFLPVTHIDPRNAAPFLEDVFKLAYQWAWGDFNFILNAGADASQSIEHTHLHLVPRRKDDGLMLPWS
jgi:histidine triad (HIT) family protein